uniref:Uncharacterized protein n=1 Tax=Arundo donax TaxID=35708 RepID=A0A0A9CVZ0_ARUDO
MLCNHSGTTHVSFIRSRIDSKIALKLFSFGFLLIRILNVPYTFSAPFSAVSVTSIWYCAVSNAILTVRISPLGGFHSSLFILPVKSFMSVPSSSRISITSHPRTYCNPSLSGTVDFATSSELRGSKEGWIDSKNKTSCSFRASHSDFICGL